MICDLGTPYSQITVFLCGCYGGFIATRFTLRFIVVICACDKVNELFSVCQAKINNCALKVEKLRHH